MQSTEQNEQLNQICRAARDASRMAASADSAERADAVRRAAASVAASREAILEANAVDLYTAEEGGIDSRVGLMLGLNEAKLDALCLWLTEAADESAAWLGMGEECARAGRNIPAAFSAGRLSPAGEAQAAGGANSDGSAGRADCGDADNHAGTAGTVGRADCGDTDNHAGTVGFAVRSGCGDADNHAGTAGFAGRADCGDADNHAGTAGTVGSPESLKRTEAGNFSAEIRVTRTPVGVAAFVCDCRPDIMLRSAGAALISGNAALLWGGLHSVNTDAALVKALREGLAQSRLSPDMINLPDPRIPGLPEQLAGMAGGAGLLVSFGERGKSSRAYPASGATVVCCGMGKDHMFVDNPSDIDLAVELTVRERCRFALPTGGPGTLLLHHEAAPRFLTALALATAGCPIEYRGCPRTREYLPDAIPAVREDWSSEHEEGILGIKVVSSAADALSHVVAYGSGGVCSLISDSEESVRAFELGAPCSILAVNSPLHLPGAGAKRGISRPLLPPQILTLLTVERLFIRRAQN